MKALIVGLRSILGLFLDDEFLAASTLVVVGAAALLLKANVIAPLADGGLLLVGCLGALLASIWRSACVKRRQ